MSISRSAWLLTLLVALLMGGCASSPRHHVAVCQSKHSHAIEALRCTQDRLRADSGTAPLDQARVDFAVVAIENLYRRYQSGEVSQEQARETAVALGRELESPPTNGVVYVSTSIIETCGVSIGSPQLQGLVRPRASLTHGIDTSPVGSMPSSSATPCVTGYCGPVNVQGYYRKDGTYVRGHTRSAPGTSRSGGKR
jgi:hypothetical protein